MKHVTANGFIKAGVAIAGTLIVCAVPSLGQRVRGGNDQKDDSRPVVRADSKPAPREERPVYRAPSPSPVARPQQRDIPRFTPSPRTDPTQQRNIPVDNTPSWRGNQPDRRPDNGGVRPTMPSPRPDPVWNGGYRSQPTDNTPSTRGGSPNRTPDNGRVRPTVPNQSPSPVWRDTPRAVPGGNPSPSTPGYRGGGNSAQKSPSDPGRGMSPRQGSLQTGPGGSLSGWRPPSREGAPGNGRAGQTASPNSRGGKGVGGIANSREYPTYRGGKPVGTVHNVPIGHGYHPPRPDHNRWSDGGRRYGGRNFYPIDLGWNDPWYHYNWGVYVGSNFYYPYYYCGPYITGYYYSPFWCYGGWSPIYIYPERVIYIQRRVYLHDVVEDDYDLYDSSMQSTMRDTMDDIKSAWLDGDGGRLLSHINQAIPVRIYQKGTYKYSLEPDDFRDVTKDALNRVQTTAFEWTNVDHVSSEEVHLEAKHTFRDPDGDPHVIRLNYTLEKASGGWWITETGTEAWNADV